MNVGILETGRPPQDLQGAFLGEFAPADTPTRTPDTRTADTRTADSGSRA